MKYFVLFLCAITILSCEKKKENVVNLAIWGNYLSPEIQKKFTDSTGIEIRMTNYASNEELLAKVQTGGSSFDVAVPSDYMVDVMGKLGLLETLDKAQLPNFHNLDPQFLAQDFDPQNTYSVPYGWTTAGIAVNRALFKGEINSWKDLFENPDLKGQISAIDDMRELAATALKLQGKSVNTTDPEEIKKSFEYLKKVKVQVKVFTANAVDLLKNKEIKAGHVYSSDALLAQKVDPQIDYIIPKEGATRAIDNMVIIKGAPHLKQAHAFINFLMTPEANVSSVLAIRAGPVVKGVKAMLPKELQNNLALFPEAATWNKLERIHDLKEKNTLFENAWAEFKSE
jgi:spermidine/putrescine transport system substrate-binding protein